MNVNITLLNLENYAQIEYEMQRIGCDSRGIQIMKPKAIFKIIRVENIRCKAANLLKQTFLSNGAEVAITKGAADLSCEYTDALIIGTLKQYKMAIPKLKMQPWGLPDLAKQIESVLTDEGVVPSRKYCWNDRKLEINDKKSLVMGILNLEQENYQRTNIMEQIQSMQEKGVDVIEVISPSFVNEDSEVDKIKKELALLEKIIFRSKIPLSIATYHAKIAEAALTLGIHMIHDLGGLQYDDEMPRVLAKHDAPVIIKYNHENLSFNQVMKDIRVFLQKSISIGIGKGIKSENMIIDPGLVPDQKFVSYVHLISHMEQLKTLGCPIVLNTLSKKDIGKVLNLPVATCGEEIATLVTLAKMKGIQIYRVHEIEEVKRTLKFLDIIARSEEDDKDFN